MAGNEGDDASKAAELAKGKPGEPTTPPKARLTDGSGSGKLRIIERVVRQTSSMVQLPPLTRTNYTEWALVMRVRLQAQGLWEVVERGAVIDYRDDREALGIILQAVPPEMLRSLAVKDSAKEAWDALKTLRMGSERVREARAQTRRSEFENLWFKDGKKMEEFAVRLTGIINDLEALGDGITEHKAVLNFLRCVPQRYRQLAHSIQSLLDLKNLMIEELTGRFLAVEESFDMDEAGSSDSGTRLLLTEEWHARYKKRGGTGKKKSTFDIRKVRCYNCQDYGHFSRDCTAPRKEQAHLAAATTADEPALL